VHSYATAFHPDFVGIKLNNLQATTRAYGVTVSQRFPDNLAAAKVADTDRTGFYFVDHTGLFFLIDRAGQLHKKLPGQTDAKGLAREIQQLLADSTVK
jgi:protein SCO1/2